MFCRVYTSIEDKNIDVILSSISKIVKSELIDGRYIESMGYSIEIRSNNDFNVEYAKCFPDGFLYFPYCLELEIEDSVNLKLVINDVNNILKYLWDSGYAAIASCPFEISYRKWVATEIMKFHGLDTD